MTLRVTLSVVPFGNESEERVIETFNISNIGLMDHPDTYSYVVEHNEYKTWRLKESGPLVVAHKRKDGAIGLVHKALAAWLNKKNKTYPEEG